MVSSVLSPEKIVGRQNTNKTAAQNFISGGSVVGASVVNSAANKIVGFQRTGARPAPSATGSIVSTISTNINNNVTNTINKTLQGFSSDYQRRLKQVDDAKPIGILGKFLNVYKTALGFINFFGNKRNIDKVRNNLEALKKSFTESFEVAKLIRQVIIKIVKQLSNLPVASPSGGGGLNLDVDIPGSGLRKSAPRGLGRMMGGKGKMLALGAGALGLGALGAGAVNALSDSPQAQAAGASPEIPGDTIDRFSSIVDRFANAISNLFKSGKTKPKQQPPGSSGKGGGTKPPGTTKPPETTGPSSYAPGTIPKEVSQDTSFTKGITELAKKYNVPEDYLYAVMGFETGGTFSPSVKNKEGSGATGLIQFMPETAKGLGTSTDALSKMTRTEQLKYVDKYFGGTLNKGGSLSDVYMSVLFPAAVGKPNDFVLFGKGAMSGYTGTAYDQNIGLDLNKDGSVTKEEASKKVREYLPKTSQISTEKGKSQVAPAPTATQTRQQVAQQVAQPPPSQQQQPVVMPINLGGGGQQQSGGGGVSAPPPSQGSGPSVPFLPAGNPDNFLVLYSRMVYNIVDG
jgi:hypothetical protein